MSAKHTLLHHFLAADLQKHGHQIAIRDRQERHPLSKRLQLTKFPVHGIQEHVGSAEYYALSNLKDRRFRIIAKDSDGLYRISAFRFQPGKENRWELRGSSKAVRDLTQFPKLCLEQWSAPLKTAI